MHMLASWPKCRRSPSCSRFAGRASARQQSSAQALDQRHRDVGGEIAAPPHAFQRGGDDARVVEHQRIALAQQLRQVAHAAVRERRLARRHHEHARRVARARRVQRDPLLRQLEIEQVRAHQLTLISSAPTTSKQAPATRPSVSSRTARSK